MSVRRALLTVVALVCLSGCTAAVPVTAASDATDPVCASIVLATPTRLGDGLDQVPTTAQATRAWGSVSAAIVLRCGVAPSGPTTTRCVAVQTTNGPSIDWLVQPDDASADPSATGWTFTTYGRVPAVQVHVPATVAARFSTSFLDQLGPAMALARDERSCQ